MAPNALRQFAHLQHAIAGALGGVERQVDLLLRADALDDVVAFEQSIEPLFAALGFLASLAGLESADEFLLLLDVLLLQFVSALLGESR